MTKAEEKKEALTIVEWPNGDFEIVLRHDQSGPASGLVLSKEMLIELNRKSGELIFKMENTPIPLSDEGSPMVDDMGKMTCNCQNPRPSRDPNGKHICTRCWGVYYK